MTTFGLAGSRARMHVVRVPFGLLNVDPNMLTSRMRVLAGAVLTLSVCTASALHGQAADTTRADSTRADSTHADSAAATRADSAACPSCAEWNAPQAPLRVYGNTYYVGPHGLGAILITSPAGHILIDGGLPQSAPVIEASIRALGFHVEDIRLILNSHVHWDHAGGIAALQHASGAVVAASPASAAVLRTGGVGRDDPQFGTLPPITPVSHVRIIADGQTLYVGELAVTAHFTAGHTPGGTTWTWQSCEAGRCLNMVYADSQSPISADGFHFTHNDTYPGALKDFEHGFTVLDSLPCDILMTPHPDASGFWERVAKRDAGDANALVDTNACHAYADQARDRLAKRVDSEKATGGE